MPLRIKVTPTHYENLCKECKDRTEGELPQLTTSAGKPYYEPECEPLPTSPCKLTLIDDDGSDDENKSARSEQKAEQQRSEQTQRNRNRRRRRNR